MRHNSTINNNIKMVDLLKNRFFDLNTAISRLSLLSAHDALILLKMSFSAPKMVHIHCAVHRASTIRVSGRLTTY